MKTTSFFHLPLYALSGLLFAAGLWTGVDARALLKEDKIVFLPSAQKAEDLVREKDAPLTESWLQRRLAMSAS